MSRTSVPQTERDPSILFPATLTWDLQSVVVGAYLDSGADDSFIDHEFACQAGISLVPLDTPLPAQALDGHPLGPITHRTEPLSLTLSGNHTETITLLVLNAPIAPLVLGRTWLRRHDPHISWSTGRILEWSTACHANCLRSAASPPSIPKPVSPPSDLSGVPPVYLDLATVFSKQRALSLPPHRPYDCSIDLVSDAVLPSSRLYNLSLPEKRTMQEYITDSLASGIIRPSKSPVAAGFFFVGKKDGSLRPCIDYRQLNNITIKNKYPLPLLSSSFEPLASATVFTKLDLRNAYHLVRIKEGDEWKTAFNTHLGHFEYLVMPFGLTNAPAVFQALVNDVLRDMLDIFVVVYLDDILIFSRTLHEHQQHVRLVLQRLLENRLFVKAEKCEFHTSSVGFLGYIIEKGHVRTDPVKVKAVVEWTQPSNRTELRQFLGFAGFYRRFIRGFSKVAAPLHALTSTLRPFKWTPEAETAFKDLKERFVTAPVLVHPNPDLPFIVEVDASDSGIGAVLSQRSETDNLLHPCAFFSRRLSPAERNYDAGNRELLAVHEALAEWRHWLEGAKHPFLVLTDHRNLTHIRAAKRLNDRQARWAQFFSRFNYTLSYRPGSRNTKADALSRQFTGEPPSACMAEPILPPARVIGVVTWGLETLVRTAQRAHPGPGGGPPNRLFVPRELRPRVLEWGHSSLFSCHPGALRTLSFIRRRFWWPSIEADTREFVAACTTCARNKASHSPPAGLLCPLPVPGRPWSHIGMDFVTGLPSSQGNTVVFTIVDRFSKAVHFVPLRKLPSSSETADLLVLHVVKQHGIPLDIVSDRGPQFTSRVWQAFCKGIGATVSLSSGYHPQSNGQAERANQCLGSMLRCVASRQPASWSKYLPWVEYAHNSMTSSATGMSPFECSLGYQPPMFPQQEVEAAVPSTRAHLRRCRRVWSTARAALLKATERMSRGANRRRVPAPAYRPGQQVLLRAKDLHLQVPSRKLAPRYVGPFPVEAIINPAAVRLTLPPSMKIHPVFHVSQLKPVAVSALSPPAPAPPPPRILEDGDPVWTVKEIMKVRRRGRGFQYLVDWEGYGPEDRSWVPPSYLADPALLDDFYQAHPDAPGRSSGVSHREGDTVAATSEARSHARSPARSPTGTAHLHSCVQSTLTNEDATEDKGEPALHSDART